MDTLAISQQTNSIVQFEFSLGVELIFLFHFVRAKYALGFKYNQLFIDVIYFNRAGFLPVILRVLGRKECELKW
jgi:hypothetical protein